MTNYCLIVLMGKDHGLDDLEYVMEKYSNNSSNYTCCKQIVYQIGGIFSRSLKVNTLEGVVSRPEGRPIDILNLYDLDCYGYVDLDGKPNFKNTSVDGVLKSNPEFDTEFKRALANKKIEYIYVLEVKEIA